MVTLDWTILYDTALHSEPQDFLESHGHAVDAILKRLQIIGFDHVSPMGAEWREQRTLFLALSDLRVLRAAFEGFRG